MHSDILPLSNSMPIRDPAVIRWLQRQEPFQTTLLFVAIVCLSIIVHYAFARASTPFQIDYEEGNILNAGARLTHGQTPYPDPRIFPYVVNPYGPVGYVLTAIALKVFGLNLFGPRMFVLTAGLTI